MRVQFDQQADAIYFRLDDSAIIGYEEVRPGVPWISIIKIQVVGVELLSVKDRVPVAMLKQLLFEVA